jgi:hypothetical protein
MLNAKSATSFLFPSTYRTRRRRRRRNVREPFAKFVDWRQCAAVMQREAVTVVPSCGGVGNVVVA